MWCHNKIDSNLYLYVDQKSVLPGFQLKITKKDNLCLLVRNSVRIFIIRKTGFNVATTISVENYLKEILHQSTVQCMYAFGLITL